MFQDVIRRALSQTLAWSSGEIWWCRSQVRFSQRIFGRYPNPQLNEQEDIVIVLGINELYSQIFIDNLKN